MILSINTKKNIAVLAAVFMILGTATAATIHKSKGNGNWTSAATWQVSGSGSPVVYVIMAGHTVTLNGNISAVDTVSIYGTLTYGNSVDLTMTNSGQVDIYPGGLLNGGNAHAHLYFSLAPLASMSGPFNGSASVNGPAYANKSTLGFTHIALPVELHQFEAVEEQHKVTLNWSTASEMNNDRFDVQRLSSEGNWLTIGTVNGSGNSNDMMYYTFTDEKPLLGENRYRLVQVDYNGAKNISPEKSVVMLKSGAALEITAYPNPANNYIEISLNNELAAQSIFSQVSVSNMMGQVFNVTATEVLGKITLDIQNLPEGMYQVKVESGKDVAVKTIMVKHF